VFTQLTETITEIQKFSDRCGAALNNDCAVQCVPNANAKANGLSKTRRNDGTPDGTAITNYVGRDSRRNNREQ